MDRNYHTDDFERLLREKSDEFRLYPSKRIWHSIYNDIHPGKKWPSVAMTITLITSLLLIGYLNTNNTNLNTASIQNSPQQIVQQQAPGYVAQINFNPAADLEKDATKTPVVNAAAPSANNLLVSEDNSSVSNLFAKPQIAAKKRLTGAVTGKASIVEGANLTPVVLVQSPVLIVSADQGSLVNEKHLIIGDEIAAPGIPLAQKIAIPALPETINYYDGTFTAGKDRLMITAPVENSLVTRDGPAAGSTISLTAEDKNWIENYALYNRPASKKWANKLSWQLYVTPSVVYRTLYNDPYFGNPVNSANNTTPLAISPANVDINAVVNHKPSIGLEAGAGLQYSVAKGVKLKAGLQFNYTRYNSHAFHNTHPVATRLTMNDFNSNTTYDIYRTTPYSNKSGLEAVKLHNETFQVSLPVGADFKVIGNEYFQWNVGVTIQPSYVAGGKSYLISSDRRNYVRESSMLNRWNLNAGFETFVSFKANGLTWQIGPQVRSQLFSTNSKKFAVEERLGNYGLKFGVTKTIR